MLQPQRTVTSLPPAAVAASCYCPQLLLAPAATECPQLLLLPAKAGRSAGQELLLLYSCSADARAGDSPPYLLPLPLMHPSAEPTLGPHPLLLLQPLMYPSVIPALGAHPLLLLLLQPLMYPSVIPALV